MRPVLILALLATALSAATLYGTLYDENFLPAQAEVTLNGTPPQTAIAPDGNYRFQAGLGDYVILAAGKSGTAQKNISITADGEYRIDLLLLPDEPVTDPLPGDDLLEDGVSTPPASQTNGTPDAGLALAGAVVLALAVIGAYWWRTRKRSAATQAPTSTKKATLNAPPELTPDQQTVLSVLDSFNGRASQKELRKALAQWSEAKVSMELTELEDKNLIRKIKKGRGNIVRRA